MVVMNVEVVGVKGMGVGVVGVVGMDVEVVGVKGMGVGVVGVVGMNVEVVGEKGMGVVGVVGMNVEVVGVKGMGVGVVGVVDFFDVKMPIFDVIWSFLADTKYGENASGKWYFLFCRIRYKNENLPYRATPDYKRH